MLLKKKKDSSDGPMETPAGNNIIYIMHPHIKMDGYGKGRVATCVVGSSSWLGGLDYILFLGA